MGVTGPNGFPCCGQKSVETVEIPGPPWQGLQFSFPHLSLVPLQLEAELMEQNAPYEEDLDLDTVPDLDVVSEKDLDMLQQELLPAAKPDPEPDLEPAWQAITPELSSEDTLPQGYKIESFPSRIEDLPSLQSSAQQSYQTLASSQHRSIRVQTSKHLFWADKLIQASEHSLQQAILRQQVQRGPGQGAEARDTVPSSQSADVLPEQPATELQQTPSPSVSASSPPLQGLGLAELVSLASSLAMASSSKMDIPSLEQIVKASPKKAEEPPPEPAQATAEDKPEPESCTETLLEKTPTGEGQQNAQKQENKTSPGHYLDFSKPGVKRANIEGEVVLLQPPARSSQLQGAREDSVPGTKKGNPLLLKIHFKLSSPSTPEK
ncbi:spermatogenesis-associated protein 32 [Ochotona curzoniae]|uniref:spermatogenesis-associated protein 32 n=1 Tax=Ochotona curzoniae TaxID=130825 RepID=UPI001B347D66|nr:spermatogenesis-associated protein 32 [Ochotona curzoniae]